MEKKFAFNPDAYHKLVKDFLGNELHLGDTVAVADKTYSKTPYITVGIIRKIETNVNKKGELSGFTLVLHIIGSSVETYGFKSGLCSDVFGEDDPDDEEYWENYTFTSKSFLNVVKISNNG